MSRQLISALCLTLLVGACACPLSHQLEAAPRFERRARATINFGPGPSGLTRNASFRGNSRGTVAKMINFGPGPSGGQLKPNRLSTDYFMRSAK